MSYENGLQSAVEQVIQSPKTLATVSVATASLGAAGVADLVHGILSSLAILAGLIATIILASVHWEKRKNERLQHKILRQQFLQMGGTDEEQE